MADYRDQISELATLMDEFRLREAKLVAGDLTVAFKRRPNKAAVAIEDSTEPEDPLVKVLEPVEQEKGTPVLSPMTGIYYSSPSPSSPPFVKVGDSVVSGQTIGLIEAMKVFNEIPCPFSGVVLKVVAEGSQLVEPGDVLLLIG